VHLATIQTSTLLAVCAAKMNLRLRDVTAPPPVPGVAVRKVIKKAKGRLSLAMCEAQINHAEFLSPTWRDLVGEVLVFWFRRNHYPICCPLHEWLPMNWRAA